MKKANFSAIVVLGAMLLAACSSSPSASNSDNVSVPSLHADPSSASYQDGYAEGQRLVNNGLVSARSFHSSDIYQAPAIVCEKYRQTSSGNLSQWLLGCVAAVRMSGNTGSGYTGNTGNTATTTTPTTTTTTVPLTSAQQAFANAVTSQLPLYVSSTNPPLTPSAIANVGSEICTAFSIGASRNTDSFVYQAMLPELANGAIEGPNGGVAVPPISGGGTDTLINLAIQNMCPQYSDGIPSG